MILVIDNYDSFTFNLVQMLVSAQVDVEVVRNDALGVTELLDKRPGAIVLSPGPGRPENAGVCVELLRSGTEIPILGVCLGHQALGYAFGGEIVGAPELMHGKTSEVHHDGSGIFAGLPDPFIATRYHSLVVDRRSLPQCLEEQAHTDDGVMMGMRHRDLPYCGVQFHPESILTETGPKMLANFLDRSGVERSGSGRVISRERAHQIAGDSTRGGAEA